MQNGGGRGIRLLIGSIVYQLVWFAAVLSATSESRWWWGPGAALLYFLCASWSWPLLRARIAKMAAVAVGAGLLFDTILILLGAWTSPRMVTPWPLPPLWLLSLWCAFGIYIAMSLQMLYGRYLLSAVVGAIGGTLAYRGGVVFGALTWGDPAWRATGLVMLAWAIAFPLLTGIAGAFAAGGPTGGDATNRQRLRVPLM